MGVLEIALLVLGTLFVIISFFIVNEKHESQTEHEPVTLSESDKNRIRENVAEIIEERTEAMMADADAHLDKLSNDKIIAVSEYSDQVLEKISTNHQEVVFLYDMLQKKEEELKSTLNSLNNSRIEYEKLYDKFTAFAAQEEKRSIERIRGMRENPASAQPARQTAARSTQTQTAAKRPATAKTPARQPARELPDETLSAALSVGKVETVEQGGMSKNDKILALHRKNKSVVEISKLLGIGQGEVKLVIDLYGNV